MTEDEKKKKEEQLEDKIQVDAVRCEPPLKYQPDHNYSFPARYGGSGKGIAPARYASDKKNWGGSR